MAKKLKSFFHKVKASIKNVISVFSKREFLLQELVKRDFKKSINARF